MQIPRKIKLFKLKSESPTENNINFEDTENSNRQRTNRPTHHGSLYSTSDQPKVENICLNFNRKSILKRFKSRERFNQDSTVYEPSLHGRNFLKFKNFINFFYQNLYFISRMTTIILIQILANRLVLYLSQISNTLLSHIVIFFGSHILSLIFKMILDSSTANKKFNCNVKQNIHDATIMAQKSFFILTERPSNLNVIKTEISLSQSIFGDAEFKENCETDSNKLLKEFQASETFRSDSNDFIDQKDYMNSHESIPQKLYKYKSADLLQNDFFNSSDGNHKIEPRSVVHDQNRKVDRKQQLYKSYLLKSEELPAKKINPQWKAEICRSNEQNTDSKVTKLIPSVLSLFDLLYRNSFKFNLGFCKQDFQDLFFPISLRKVAFSILRAKILWFFVIEFPVFIFKSQRKLLFDNFVQFSQRFLSRILLCLLGFSFILRFGCCFFFTSFHHRVKFLSLRHAMKTAFFVFLILHSILFTFERLLQKYTAASNELTVSLKHRNLLQVTRDSASNSSDKNTTRRELQKTTHQSISALDANVDFSHTFDKNAGDSKKPNNNLSWHQNNNFKTSSDECGFTNLQYMKRVNGDHCVSGNLGRNCKKPILQNIFNSIFGQGNVSDSFTNIKNGVFATRKFEIGFSLRNIVEEILRFAVDGFKLLFLYVCDAIEGVLDSLPAFKPTIMIKNSLSDFQIQHILVKNYINCGKSFSRVLNDLFENRIPHMHSFEEFQHFIEVYYRLRKSEIRRKIYKALGLHSRKKIEDDVMFKYLRKNLVLASKNRILIEKIKNCDLKTIFQNFLIKSSHQKLHLELQNFISSMISGEYIIMDEKETNAFESLYHITENSQYSDFSKYDSDFRSFYAHVDDFTTVFFDHGKISNLKRVFTNLQSAEYKNLFIQLLLSAVLFKKSESRCNNYNYIKIPRNLFRSHFETDCGIINSFFSILLIVFLFLRIGNKIARRILGTFRKGVFYAPARGFMAVFIDKHNPSMFDAFKIFLVVHILIRMFCILIENSLIKIPGLFTPFHIDSVNDLVVAAQLYSVILNSGLIDNFSDILIAVIYRLSDILDLSNFLFGDFKRVCSPNTLRFCRNTYKANRKFDYLIKISKLNQFKIIRLFNGQIEMPNISSKTTKNGTIYDFSTTSNHQSNCKLIKAPNKIPFDSLEINHSKKEENLDCDFQDIPYKQSIKNNTKIFSSFSFHHMEKNKIYDEKIGSLEAKNMELFSSSTNEKPKFKNLRENTHFFKNLASQMKKIFKNTPFKSNIRSLLSSNLHILKQLTQAIKYIICFIAHYTGSIFYYTTIKNTFITLFLPKSSKYAKSDVYSANPLGKNHVRSSSDKIESQKDYKTNTNKNLEKYGVIICHLPRFHVIRCLILKITVILTAFTLFCIYSFCFTSIFKPIEFEVRQLYFDNCFLEEKFNHHSERISDNIYFAMSNIDDAQELNITEMIHRFLDPGIMNANSKPNVDKSCNDTDKNSFTTSNPSDKSRSKSSCINHPQSFSKACLHTLNMRYIQKLVNETNVWKKGLQILNRNRFISENDQIEDKKGKKVSSSDFISGIAGNEKEYSDIYLKSYPPGNGNLVSKTTRKKDDDGVYFSPDKKPNHTHINHSAFDSTIKNDSVPSKTYTTLVNLFKNTYKKYRSQKKDSDHHFKFCEKRTNTHINDKCHSQEQCTSASGHLDKPSSFSQNSEITQETRSKSWRNKRELNNYPTKDSKKSSYYKDQIFDTNSVINHSGKQSNIFNENQSFTDQMSQFRRDYTDIQSILALNIHILLISIVTICIRKFTSGNENLLSIIVHFTTKYLIKMIWFFFIFLSALLSLTLTYSYLSIVCLNKNIESFLETAQLDEIILIFLVALSYIHFILFCPLLSKRYSFRTINYRFANFYATKIAMNSVFPCILHFSIQKSFCMDINVSIFMAIYVGSILTKKTLVTLNRTYSQQR